MPISDGFTAQFPSQSKSIHYKDHLLFGETFEARTVVVALPARSTPTSDFLLSVLTLATTSRVGVSDSFKTRFLSQCSQHPSLWGVRKEIGSTHLIDVYTMKMLSGTH